MTAKFDWSQFESSDKPEPSGFNWESFESLEKKEPGFKEMGRDALRLSKVIGSELAGSPGDVIQTATAAPLSLIEKITGAQVPDETKSLIRSLLPFGNLPTSEELKQTTEKFFPSLTPTTEKEKGQEEIVGLLSSLLMPLPGAKGKKFVDPKSLEKLYQAGKAWGLSPKQLTPLFQSEKKLSVLGKFGKMTPELRKSFEVTENALSDVYKTISSNSKALLRLTAKSEANLLDKFADVKMNLEKTLQPSPDKQAAIHFIEKAMGKLSEHGANPEELINFYHDINSAVNWGAVKGGKKMLRQLMEPVKDSIRNASPKLYQDFSNANALWSKMKRAEKSIGLPKIEKYISYGKWAAPLIGMTLGHTGFLTGLETAAAYEALSRVSTKLLTDPKWQSLHKKALHSIKEKSPSLGFKTFQAIKNLTRKEMPKEYEEIDWNQFE